MTGGTYALIVYQTLKPDIVINAGTAGGFKKHDTAIGDVFISSRVKNHDRRSGTLGKIPPVQRLHMLHRTPRDSTSIRTSILSVGLHILFLHYNRVIYALHLLVEVVHLGGVLNCCLP